MSLCKSASQVSSAPATEPLTTAEVKLHLRVSPDQTEEDAAIVRLVESAREYVEEYTERQLVTATRTQKFSGWGSGLRLDRSPVASVSSVTYLDWNGDTQTLASNQYRVLTTHEPCLIVPEYNVVWPVLRSVPDSITVTFVCGYGAASAVPSRAKEAILLLVGDSYENRESSGTPRNLDAVNRLLSNFRVGSYA